MRSFISIDARNVRKGALAGLEIAEKAFFSTRSTALHHSEALTLRGGSA
jgi:hypothetical protein